MRIALVDDSEIERGILLSLITDYGCEKQILFESDCFDSGDAFLSSFSSDKYDIVFMDIFMNGMSGVETAIFACLNDASLHLPASETFISFSVNAIEVRIFASQIVCIVADSHYTWITDRNGQKYHPCAAFGTFSKQLLSDRHFLLVSRGVLCNMGDIKCFSSGSCLLSNGQTLPVTLRNAKRIEQTWRDYCFSKTRDQTLEI